MSGLHWEQPGWLWAGAALIGASAVAIIATWRFSLSASRRHRVPASSFPWTWLLRAVLVGLVLAAIGRPTWTRNQGPGRLIVLIDRSASMPPHWSEEAIRQVAAALTQSAAARIDAFTFAGQSQAADLRQLIQPDSPLLLPADPADGSDPNPALQLSQSPDHARRTNTVLLLTDGNWTAPLHPSAGLPGQPGLQLWSLCPRQGRAHAGFIDLVAAPTPSPSTQPDGSVRYFVRATLSATRTAEVAVRLSLRAGEKWSIIPGTEQRVQLAAEQVRSVDWTIDGPPLTQIRAELTGPADWADNLPGDNPLVALTPALPGRRPILLISSQPDDELSRSLGRLAGWQVMRLSPSELSAGGATSLLSVARPPGAVVLDDISADALPNAVVAALRDYVNSGGGLLVVGGPNSLGAGHYFDSPIESLLPVITRPRNHPPAAIVLVLDRSGSMSESAAAASTGGSARSTPRGEEAIAANTPPGESKLDLVKQAVLSLPDLFAAGDRLAVIGFSDTAVTAYATPEAGTVDWQAVRRALRDMQARGGTAAKPAIRAAADWLARQNVSRKHLLLLTDGEFDDLTLDGADKLLRGTTQPDGRLTVSTFAIGDQAGRKFLADLAARFGGTYYAPERWGRLRDNFRDELAGATVEPILTGRFAVQPTDSRDPLGPVSKVLADEERPSAQVWYWAQADSRHQPIVATGPVGAGRSAVVATAWRPDWSGNWTDAQRDRLLAQLLDDLTGQDDDPRFLLHYDSEPANGKLALEIYASHRGDSDGVRAADQPIDGLDLSAELIGSAGVTASTPLHQTGPGRYVASLDWIDASRLVIAERTATGSRVVVRRTLSAPVPAELRHLSPQPGALDTLCRQHGGRLLDSPADVSGLKLAAEPRTTPLWPALLLAALVLWLVEVTRLRQTKR